MFTTTLTMDTRLKLYNHGLITPYSNNGYFLLLKPLPFKTIFPELPFHSDRIPHYYETKQYLEYLGFNMNQALDLFVTYQIKNPTRIVNRFTLLIEAKNHIQNISKSDVLSRKYFKEVDEIGSGAFIWYEKFGMTADIIQDVDLLLKSTRENPSEMDRYLGYFKKFEDLVLADFMIEVVDRRAMKLITLERDSKAFFQPAEIRRPINEGKIDRWHRVSNNNPF